MVDLVWVQDTGLQTVLTAVWTQRSSSSPAIAEPAPVNLTNGSSFEWRDCSGKLATAVRTEGTPHRLFASSVAELQLSQLLCRRRRPTTQPNNKPYHARFRLLEPGYICHGSSRHQNERSAMQRGSRPPTCCRRSHGSSRHRTRLRHEDPALPRQRHPTPTL